MQSCTMTMALLAWARTNGSHFLETFFKSCGQHGAIELE